MTPSPEFLAEMDRKENSQPKSKIEFIDKFGVVTDISKYFSEGGNLKTVRERAPDEIQAGQFDIVLINHDDLWSELKFGSILYGGDYHGSRIRLSQGFILPDGTEEYITQGVGYIDAVSTDPVKSKITIRCRDLLWRIMDQKMRVRPPEEIPAPGVSNVGDGYVSRVDTKPFSTTDETWTLTCTLGGGDGTATFDVVGSVSGNIGTATSGDQFTHDASGVQFTIHRGPVAWTIGDTFTFQTYQGPEWEYVNAGKIIWSILTGYDWDTDTPLPWRHYVFDYDHTKSSANTDLDYDSFVDSIDKISLIGLYDLKGYVRYDEDAVELMQTILLLFLGSIYTGNDGRIKFRTYLPVIGSTYRTFADARKIKTLSMHRTIDEVINAVAVSFKQSDEWPFTNDSLDLDGAYAIEDPVSISKYKRLGAAYSVPWKTTHNLHVQDFGAKIIAKFNAPPINIDFNTGMDGLLTEIGDRVVLEDTKLGITDFLAEISMVSKMFDKKPTAIMMRARRDSELGEKFGYIGSEIDEGDGISPQSDDYDSASVTDKEFAYFSEIGATDPDYRIF